MVLPIGFFMPLPLAMMIPFMGIQSAVMAKQFGENFQYGKRRISAMSNEEFNKLTPVELLKQNTAEIKAMIPTMKESIINMNDFQQFLVKEFLDMIGDLLTSGIGKILGLSADEVNQTIQDIEHYIHGHGGLAGHETKPPPNQVAPPPSQVPKDFPPLEVPKNVPTIENPITPTLITLSFLLKNSQGMLEQYNSSSILLTNLGATKSQSKWKKLKQGKQSDMVAFATASWPQSGYNKYTIKVTGTGTLRSRTFWILKSKL